MTDTKDVALVQSIQQLIGDPFLLQNTEKRPSSDPFKQTAMKPRTDNKTSFGSFNNSSKRPNVSLAQFGEVGFEIHEARYVFGNSFLFFERLLRSVRRFYVQFYNYFSLLLMATLDRL